MEKEKITPNEGEVKTAEKAQAAINDEAEADATMSTEDSPLDESKEEYMVEPTEAEAEAKADDEDEDDGTEIIEDAEDYSGDEEVESEVDETEVEEKEEDAD